MKNLFGQKNNRVITLRGISVTEASPESIVLLYGWLDDETLSGITETDICKELSDHFQSIDHDDQLYYMNALDALGVKYTKVFTEEYTINN